MIAHTKFLYGADTGLRGVRNDQPVGLTRDMALFDAIITGVRAVTQEEAIVFQNGFPGPIWRNVDLAFHLVTWVDRNNVTCSGPVSAAQWQTQGLRDQFVPVCWDGIDTLLSVCRLVQEAVPAFHSAWEIRYYRL